MHDAPASRVCQGKLKLPGNVLGPAVKVAGIKGAILQDDISEGILDDHFLLVVIKLRGQDHPGMVINGRGKVSLHYGAILTDRKLWAILDVSLSPDLWCNYTRNLHLGFSFEMQGF